MRSRRLAPLQAGFAFALGVVLGSGFLSGFAPRADAPSKATVVANATAACTSGDTIGNFVCRNRWMGEHQYSYR